MRSDSDIHPILSLIKTDTIYYNYIWGGGWKEDLKLLTQAPLGQYGQLTRPILDLNPFCSNPRVIISNCSRTESTQIIIFNSMKGRRRKEGQSDSSQNIAKITNADQLIVRSL